MALITGASSGIGRTTALAFAVKGYDVAIGARRLDRLEEVAVRARERYGVDALARACDVAREDDVAALVEATLDRFGRVDVAVLNAGQGYYGLVEETPAEDFRALLEVNVLGVHHGIREVVPLMRRQGFGHIAVVGSVSGKRGWPYHGAYAATKFALGGLVQSLRAELEGSGVTASLILPAGTDTEFFARSKAIGHYEPRRIGPMQHPREVAKAVVRSVDRPSPEINVVPPMRAAFVIAEAVPWLADYAARWFMRHRAGPAAD